MKPDDDQLQAQEIDEEIERLMQAAPEETLENNKNAQLIQDLQHYYASEKQKEILQRAWESITQRYEDGMPLPLGEGYAQNQQNREERPGQYSMHEQTTKILPMKSFFPRWGILVAVAVLALAIGSVAVIMSQNAIGQNKTPGAGKNIKYSTCLLIPTTAPKQPVATAAPEPITTTVECTPLQTKPTPTVAPSGPMPKPTVASTEPMPTAVPTGPVPPIKIIPTTVPIKPIPTAAPIKPIPTAAPSSGNKPVPTAAPIKSLQG